MSMLIMYWLIELQPGDDSRNFRGKPGCLLYIVFDDEEELRMGVFVSGLAEGTFLTLIALRLLLGQVYLPQNLR